MPGDVGRPRSSALGHVADDALDEGGVPRPRSRRTRRPRRPRDSNVAVLVGDRAGERGARRSRSPRAPRRSGPSSRRSTIAPIRPTGRTGWRRPYSRPGSWRCTGEPVNSPASDGVDDVVVEVAPAHYRAGEPAVGRQLGGVGVVADDIDAGLLGGLGDRRRAVLVLGDDVDALGEQAARGLRLLGRVAPVRRVDEVRLGVGVDRLGAELEGVDVGDRLGDREGVDVAELVRLGRLARPRCRRGRPARTPCRSTCRRSSATLPSMTLPCCTTTTSGWAAATFMAGSRWP